jgi:hypothetical protein
MDAAGASAGLPSSAECNATGAGDDRLHVRTLGDDRAAEFAAVRTMLAERARFEPFASPQPTPDVADLLVVFQSRPGEVTQEEIEAAHRLCPAAPIVAVLGSWCEGEMRSGRPWHGVERVYWYNAPARLQRHLDRTSPRGYRTESAADVIERATPPAATHAVRRAGIIAATRAAFEPLADACQVLGYEAVWQRTLSEIPSDIDLLLWRVDDCAEIATLAPSKLPTGDMQTIVVANFPRRHDVQALAKHGIEVLGAPFLLADLAAMIAVDHEIACERDDSASPVRRTARLIGQSTE